MIRLKLCISEQLFHYDSKRTLRRVVLGDLLYPRRTDRMSVSVALPMHDALKPVSMHQGHPVSKPAEVDTCLLGRQPDFPQE